MNALIDKPVLDDLANFRKLGLSPQYVIQTTEWLFDDVVQRNKFLAHLGLRISQVDMLKLEDAIMNYDNEKPTWKNEADKQLSIDKLKNKAALYCNNQEYRQFCNALRIDLYRQEA